MRFQTNNKIGEQRIVEKFLWLPLTIQNCVGPTETRWLERIKVRQRFYFDANSGIYSWKNVEFL